VGGGAFGCLVFGHLGFAHARRLRPGIGRLAGAADTFGRACDTGLGRRVSASVRFDRECLFDPERRVGVGIGFDRECTLDFDVGCVFDIYFGLAKVTASSSFIVGSGFISGRNTAGVRHIGIGAEISCRANTVRGHCSAHVCGTRKN
jgi:hypothetical protein